MNEKIEKFDVCILGGGMAGLTLALQLKQSEPNLEIIVLEKRKGSPKNATHKVGESTVELGTYYLRETLGLKSYLETHHLPKFGLRLFFSNGSNAALEDRMEYGVRMEPPVPSHQLDRGKLERDLASQVTEMGVHLRTGATVDSVELGKAGHQVEFQSLEGEKVQINAKWITDATGRFQFLRRKLGLEKQTEHVVHASWFRLKGEVHITDWSQDEEWKNYIPEKSRYLSTVHLVGKGYWLWIIPLPGGNTSVGLVIDPRYHNFSEMDTQEKIWTWLGNHEPQAAGELQKKEVLDFRKLKNHAFESKKLYSADGWGLVGEAGNFLDAFYSPGADFIGMGNSWMTDLILSDYRKENIQIKANIYDLVSKQLYNYWTPIYKDKYKLFGNAQVMVSKIIWDFAVYWSVPCVLFTSGGLTNLNSLKKIFIPEDNLGAQLGELNSAIQQFFIDWDAMDSRAVKASFIDPGDIPFMHDLLRGIEETQTGSDWLFDKLSENIGFLEKMAAEIMRGVFSQLKLTPQTMAVDPYRMRLSDSNEALIKKSQEAGALSYSEKLAMELKPIWLERMT